jgi:hypothetical protein
VRDGWGPHINGQWITQAILQRDARWSRLLATDPTKRLVERARIADRAVRRATAAGDTAEPPTLETQDGQAVSKGFRAGTSVEINAQRIYREAYRVYDWITAPTTDGCQVDRRLRTREIPPPSCEDGSHQEEGTDDSVA